MRRNYIQLTTGIIISCDEKQDFKYISSSCAQIEQGFVGMSRDSMKAAQFIEINTNMIALEWEEVVN